MHHWQVDSMAFVVYLVTVALFQDIHKAHHTRMARFKIYARA